MLPGSIEGLDSSLVCSAEDALRNLVPLGERLAVIGGGLVGVETAVHFDKIGKKVVLLEMADKLLPNPPFPMNEMHLRGLLAESGVEIHTGCKVTSVSDDGIVAESPEGKIHIPCDNVLMALGYLPTVEQAECYQEICPVVTLGDCNRARNIMAAVTEAYEAVNGLK